MVTLAEERRGPVVETIKRWSRRGTIRIIEDAAYRELRYAGDDVPSLRSYDPEGDTVILTETFSKSFSPGMRVGWGFLPRDLIEPVANQKGNIDFGSPNFSQHVMAAVMEAGLAAPAHREAARPLPREAHRYAGRLRRVSWARCPASLGAGPQGGIYVWLRLPEHIDAGPSGSLFDHAVEEGVLYVPGEYFYPDPQPQRRHEHDPPVLRRAIGRAHSPRHRGLARAIRAVLT